MTRDSFAARWSRLKGAAAQQGAQEAAPAADAPAPAPSAPPLSPEEVAALPPVETLTPFSDIAPYLRKGVPALLRNAAMRRMWTLNPAIRDYVDDAMEYAMDWNTPGAILGAGPLNAGDDPLAMARKLMGNVEKEAPEATPEAPPEADAPPPAVTGQGVADQGVAPAPGATAAAPETSPSAADAADAGRTAPRRHGGAAPS